MEIKSLLGLVWIVLLLELKSFSLMQTMKNLIQAWTNTDTSSHYFVDAKTDNKAYLRLKTARDYSG